MRALAVMLTVVAATRSATVVREEVNFDFAWRHQLGNPAPPRPCGAIEKGVNYGTGGIEHTGVADAPTCCNLCGADPTCIAWDWNPNTGDCWLKETDLPKVSEDRVSGRIPLPPPPPGPPPQALPGYDDSHWELVNAPHDMLITEPVLFNNTQAQGNLARNVGWYRKHFALPAEWAGDALYLYVEGVFHVSQFYLNGVLLAEHDAGYTSFAIRLDNATGLQYGDKSANVLAVYVDASFGDGWWYEGGGLFRHLRLIRAAPLHFSPDRAWAYANITGAIAPHTAGQPAAGLAAKSATLTASAELGNFAASAVSGPVALDVVRVIDAAGHTLSGASGSAVVPSGVPGDGAAVLGLSVDLPGPVELWSVARPYLYTVELAARVGDGNVTDRVNLTIGVRSVRFDANIGLVLNGERVKVRGFCDHSTFGGVGAAVPDRINLFRVQALRAVGANAWRMAHNPPAVARLDFMDRLGMMAMDENRDYGGAKQQGGISKETPQQQVADMGDLVQRDRNHPAVIVWSFCNEVGCNNETAAKPFREVSYLFDGTRPVTQNHLGSNTSSFYLDVQGFSHRSGSTFDEFHNANPDKPMMATECCSCMSQRGEDADLTPDSQAAANASRPGLFYNNLIQECTASQVLDSDGRDFVAGTFVWSGFDYMGEARGWPQIVKCRGTVSDVAGFTKETAYWLRAWWLSNITTTDAGRPPAASAAATTVFIVESWVPPLKGIAFRQVHVYTNAPTVRLELNGQPVGGGPATVPYFGAAAFNVTYAAGNLTAVACDAAGKPLASFSRVSAGVPAALRLSLDAPSPLTGTGAALVADGEDAALLRAEVLDAHGNIVPDATTNVTFRIVSGEGALWATHNGDPATHVAPHETWHPAYHGLVRAVVRSTADQATLPLHRRRLRQIDLDGGRLVRVADPDAVTGESVAEIVVEASADGLQPARVSIPVTADLAQRPREVATRSVALAAELRG